MAAAGVAPVPAALDAATYEAAAAAAAAHAVDCGINAAVAAGVEVVAAGAAI